MSKTYCHIDCIASVWPLNSFPCRMRRSTLHNKTYSVLLYNDADKYIRCRIFCVCAHCTYVATGG